MTKHMRYRLHLTGEPEAVGVLERRLPRVLDTLREARDLKRALNTVFAGAVRLDIVGIKDEDKEKE